ncbi:hypothetical protein [Comamonas endophytica]|uniref:Uncharacterized protein n=1 Tax=Comamonas endophytica TaxID=2949090 RepID=A0ABY6GG84_9BURK|nr:MULTISPECIES: hypothetical protein [unclassified Acidovorax]MCD2514658.1 hypothetical protein [Acidovorax sp. D4N7]UYG53970.1 hypothetical protein M9799_20405 [Acidovorax sp. 5MLIR]UYG54009.1 hypothetical protein M9799_19965 [Acidovorax sp. 5MLIR]
MMKINIWIFLSSIITAIIIGGLGTSLFITRNTISEKVHLLPQECVSEPKETFRFDAKQNDTDLNKGY